MDRDELLVLIDQRIREREAERKCRERDFWYSIWRLLCSLAEIVKRQHIEPPPTKSK
jgi:hypothetical protein